VTNAQLWAMGPTIALALVVLFVIFFYKTVVRLFGVVIVPEDSAGIVNKKYALVGQHRTLPPGAIIALHGEAGLQADALAPGLHFGLWPWQYVVTLQKFITISQDNIGIVEARDGHPLTDGHVLARRVNFNTFQDARAFLEGGGERGPQMTIIPPGTYRINTALFTVQPVKVLDIPDNMLGVVTTKEGRPLAAGEIASRPVDGHNSFQDAQAFVDAGGGKGLQEQVMLAGRYFVNPRFATVEIKDTTIVPIANVGVVIAYIGREGVDVTGDAFKHGNLVNKGEKGVWVEPMDPGKYPINPYTHRVEIVPTANVVLNWATGKTEAHNLDKNLSTITVRSSDGFTFNLDVSQIIHIPRAEAPKVIARFGSMVNLVTQVLEPTIGNYFRNAAQGSDVIDFLRTRRERQDDARKQISSALTDYNVVAVDTLIGDITPPEALMTTLTDRKLAEQEKVTYDTQRLAEETRKELQQATAMANTQASVVAAQRQVQIQEFQASAAVKTAEGQAASLKLVADGEAYATRATGNADAEKTRAVGTAEADVIKLKIASMDSGNYAGIEISKALAGSGFKLVPDVVVNSGGSGSTDGGNSLVSVLLANLIREGRGKRND
jgi:uncharacterized membrane protein YqiK